MRNALDRETIASSALKFGSIKGQWLEDFRKSQSTELQLTDH
jgi:hypothetical protein